LEKAGLRPVLMMKSRICDSELSHLHGSPPAHILRMSSLFKEKNVFDRKRAVAQKKFVGRKSSIEAFHL
jgi:hypothetical protein